MDPQPTTPVNRITARSGAWHTSSAGPGPACRRIHSDTTVAGPSARNVPKPAQATSIACSSQTGERNSYPSRNARTCRCPRSHPEPFEPAAPLGALPRSSAESLKRGHPGGMGSRAAGVGAWEVRRLSFSLHRYRPRAVDGADGLGVLRALSVAHSSGDLKSSASARVRPGNLRATWSKDEPRVVGRGLLNARTAWFSLVSVTTRELTLLTSRGDVAGSLTMGRSEREHRPALCRLSWAGPRRSRR